MSSLRRGTHAYAHVPVHFLICALTITFQLHFTISLKKTIFRYLQDPSGLSTLNAIPSPQVGPPALMCWKLMKPWIVEVWSKFCFAILNSDVLFFHVFFLIYFRFAFFDLFNPFHTWLIMFVSLLFSSYIFCSFLGCIVYLLAGLQPGREVRLGHM